MSSQRILITGATDGIGRQTARELAALGHELILHGRSADKLGALAAELRDAHGEASIHTVRADFSSLEEVRAMGQELRERFASLDVLLNNAGVFMNDAHTSQDGFEQTMAVNHLAPFLLTHLALPLLEASDGRARIVNVSSIAHTRGRVEEGDLSNPPAFDPYRSYAASKLANVLFTRALALRLDADQVTVNALHPGVVSTKLLTEGFGMSGPDSLEEGSQTSKYLALDPAVEGLTGRYFSNTREARMSEIASNEALVHAFYLESAEATGLQPLVPR